MDILKKDNFDLRLKIYFLEIRLHDLSPTNLENALKEVKKKEKKRKKAHNLSAHTQIINFKLECGPESYCSKTYQGIEKI